MMQQALHHQVQQVSTRHRRCRCSLQSQGELEDDQLENLRLLVFSCHEISPLVEEELKLLVLREEVEVLPSHRQRGFFMSQVSVFPFWNHISKLTPISGVITMGVKDLSFSGGEGSHTMDRNSVHAVGQDHP